MPPRYAERPVPARGGWGQGGLSAAAGLPRSARLHRAGSSNDSTRQILRSPDCPGRDPLKWIDGFSSHLGMKFIIYGREVDPTNDFVVEPFAKVRQKAIRFVGVQK
jgi:hypothetical protein